MYKGLILMGVDMEHQEKYFLVQPLNSFFLVNIRSPKNGVLLLILFLITKQKHLSLVTTEELPLEQKIKLVHLLTYNTLYHHN